MCQACRTSRFCFWRSEAFTILEMLVSTVIVCILIFMMVSLVSQTSAIWQRSSDTVEAFQSARLAYEVITRNLSQATLNTYLDYDNEEAPSHYLRASDLAFVSGSCGTAGLPGTPGTGQAIFFQALLGSTGNTTSLGGLDGLLNSCGYFVSYTTNVSIPAHVSSRDKTYRYRLMQLMVPAESNTIYRANQSSTAWYSGFTNSTYPVADNVIALVIRPLDPAKSPGDILTNTYSYDSRRDATAIPQPATANQLPPVVEVTMIAIEESAAKRLETGGQEPTVISDALSGKFQSPSAFQTDLGNLEKALNENRIPYRIFSSAVPIRESKWTK